MSAPVPANTVARLLRPGAHAASTAVSVADREHATAVVAHLLHEEWQSAEDGMMRESDV